MIAGAKKKREKSSFDARKREQTRERSSSTAGKSRGLKKSAENASVSEKKTRVLPLLLRRESGSE